MRIGELLVQLGRITPAQVEEALAHQRERGGFLGDALIRLGFISRDELRWTLADQHDIPFVRLHPDHIDHGLAALTPAAWAREHHILPVLRDGDRVTAVIGDVADLEKLDEVRRMTGAAVVEAALSSPETIRDLIDAVYGPATQPPVRFLQLAAEALRYGAEALGVSVREGAAVGWYRIVETVYRPLEAEWSEELGAALAPAAPPAGEAGAGHRAWPALLTVGAAVWRVECQSLGQGRSREWLARLTARVPEGLADAAVDPDLREEVQRAMARGPLLLRVAPLDGEADAVAAAIPHLPALFLGRGARAVHLSDLGAPAGDATLALPLRAPLADELAPLGDFFPQAVTVDARSLRADDADALRRTSPFSVVRAREDLPPGFSHDFEIGLCSDAGGFRWMLVRSEDGEN